MFLQYLESPAAFCQKVLLLSLEGQEKLWANLAKTGMFTCEDIHNLQKLVGYYKILNNSNYHDTMMAECLKLYLEHS